MAANAEDAFQAEVTALARRIAELGAGEKAGVFRMSWWSERMLSFAMSHPSFKTQLFRFVDVFPATTGDADVLRHIDEYFDGADVPRLLDVGVDVADHMPGGSRLSASIARRQIRRMAQQFIVGTSPADAVHGLADLWRRGSVFTVDLLGEKTVTEAEADRYAARVAELLSTLTRATAGWPPDDHLEFDDRGPLPRVNVSIKPTALASLYSPLSAEDGIAQARSRLTPLLQQAATAPAFVWFDMEHYDVKNLTLRLFRECAEAFPAVDVGVVVQAYLRDSWTDLHELVEWARGLDGSGRRIGVRLVKGAYWDSETITAKAEGWPVPVFGDKDETDANFERCARFMHESGDVVRAAFGSHNLRSLAFAVTCARSMGIPDSAYELQMLYGMAEPIQAAIRRLGMRLRIYAPVGELVPGMAYLVRRLLENTSNESFVRHRFAEGRNLDELLRAPRVAWDALPGVESAPLAALSPGYRTQRDQTRTAPGAGRLPGASKPTHDGGPRETSVARGCDTNAGAPGRGSAPGRGGAPTRDPDGGPRKATVARGCDTNPADPGPYHHEPVAEWRRPVVQAAFAVAVERADARRRPIVVPAVVNGERFATAAAIASVDPAEPERVVATSASATGADADAAVAAALAAFERWSRTPAADRAAVLFGAAAWMRERRNELSALEVFEAGKPWKEADADVCEAIDFCEYYGREMRRLAQGGTVESPPGERNTLHYQGKGVGVVIAPWNFPLAIPTGMVAAALVTGNTVVFKPAEQTPAIAFKLIEALEAGGLPPGVCNFLPGVGEDVGACLVAHPDVAFITFTGSKAVGLSINQVAASSTGRGRRHIKRVVAELGGKNALVVDGDADLDQAVPAIIQSAFGFAGQKCSAASRLVVVDAVFDELLDRLVGATAELRVGHPKHMTTHVGPVIDADAYKRLRGAIDAAPEQGRVVYSHDALPEQGWFAGPTIVADVALDAPLARDELFGPVLCCLRAPSFDAAIDIANDTDYALTAGVLSRSPAHIAQASAELRAGNVYVNRGITGAVVGHQPFGGYGLSGVGSKAGGPDYLLQFLDPRVVTENTMRQGFAPD
jgi:RHH-type proline utilization regulon transcriptional repressor/proline dehydrogenase/delta 1-pyrroline-5-carboxylate dehydrogenase